MRRTYSDSDRARVFAELTATDGNIKRTARHTGIPVSTVRFWKQQWDKGGVPAVVQEALPMVVGDFIADATRVRDKLLVYLEEKVDRRELSAKEIVPALGMIVDKLRAYQGLEKVSRVEHTIEFPELSKMRDEMAVIIRELVSAGNKRQEIIEGEWEESAQEALPQAQEVMA